jgi:RNA polymerase sigma-70 factor, ECF subfamily
MPTDAELLHAWRGGGGVTPTQAAEAGEALFDRYFDSIRRFFLNKTPEHLDDLMQKTFKGCLEGKERVREGGSFRSYLFGIAHNVLRGHLREKGRSKQLEDLDEVSVRDLNPGPMTLVGRQREERLLLRALRTIPVAQQVLLELHYWEQMKSPEISLILDVPENTVRSRLSRAHDKLRAVMQQLAESPAELQSTTADLDQWAQQCRDRLGDPPTEEVPDRG